MAKRDETGFLALPAGGWLNNDLFHSEGYCGYWCKSREYVETHGMNLQINFSAERTFKSLTIKDFGFPIRCMIFD